MHPVSAFWQLFFLLTLLVLALHVFAAQEQLKASNAEIETLRHTLGSKDLDVNSRDETIAGLKQALSETQAKLDEATRAQSFGVTAADANPAGLGSGRPCVRYGTSASLVPPCYC